MNIAYFRKSTFDLATTAANVRTEAESAGLTVLGETALPGNAGTVIHVCNPSWLGNLIASDANLIGLLPCSVAVLAAQDGVNIGVGSPAVLSGVSQHPAVAELAARAQESLTNLVNAAAGVGPRKPVSLKLYSTMTCPYCKAEASWLDGQKIRYEEVHVDLNRKEAEAMVQKTGQMGVPVTTVTYDDGDEEHIIGFDKPRLSAIVSAMKTDATVS